MLKTLRNAFKIEEIQKEDYFYTADAGRCIDIGSQLPVLRV